MRRELRTTRQLEEEMEDIRDKIIERNEQNEELVESLSERIHPLGYNIRAPYFDFISISHGVHGADDFKRFEDPNEFLDKEGALDKDKLLKTVLPLIKEDCLKIIRDSEDRISRDSTRLLEVMRECNEAVVKCDELLENMR